MSGPPGEGVEPVWMVVAKVCTAAPDGETHQPRLGTRWLHGDAKVYVVGCFPGMGLQTATVIGHNRRTKAFFRQHLRSRLLVDWRVKLVYSPTVIRLAGDTDEPGWAPIPYGPEMPLDGSPERRTRLEELVRSVDADVTATGSAI